MGLLSDELKHCGVKILTTIKGVHNFGSGVVYVTPNYLDYNYIITAKHIFQEDPDLPLNHDNIGKIEVLYSSHEGQLKRLEYIKKSDVKKRLIGFEKDFAIIIINKNEEITFSPIFVSDKLENEDLDFFSWGVFLANKDRLKKFELKRDDTEMKSFKLQGNYDPNYLPGISGGGVFHANKNILFGIICKYPNEKFQGETIDCTLINFSEVNEKLKLLNKIELDTESSRSKREINNKIIDIHQAFINNVCLDLEIARKRLKIDMMDDWFHDPLQYIDLLNQDYLFEQFKTFFEVNKYEAEEAENFFVPKKKLTLRQALISPFIDRIMYMATVGVLADKLDKSMIPNVYSARYNKFSENQLILNGVEQWRKMKYICSESANQVDEHGNYIYGAVIQIDILNFYDNINKKLLVEKIKRVCETENEKNASTLLEGMIKNFSKKELGLPQNSDASSLLASFYLNQIDVLMRNISPAYYRFMDDIRIFCKDKYEARRILQTFEFELRRCHLSVNSQKTEILNFVDVEKTTLLSNECLRNLYDDTFDLELNKLATLRKSENYTHRNEAFHLSIRLLKENLNEDLNNSEESASKLNYSLNTIALLVKTDINSHTTSFEGVIKSAVSSLKDKPWITTQICKVLNLIPTETIINDYLGLLKMIVLDDRYNTYSFQTYQIWLLLAKHKCDARDLRRFACEQIEKNDETNRAVIASMILYICSVDTDYRRVILRKFGEKFTRRYFQNRIALIALRSFPVDIIDSKIIDKSLISAHQFTHKYKNRDLIFVQGFEEQDDEESENLMEQLYSI
ncbi:RNA-directed DNA polymerase [Flavobacterium gelatinilyticum]|uniref:RNA-directed DNA polymerase n=1 Tax=Flavobacterium gelatinilyticum TaxID=3003260 RepID=UPI0024814665|nr:RNA-directed DNA polymerase [Flavobacterium gelatinilyticum]